MDGYFVPNLTFGPQTVQALAVYKQDLFFDVHLMLNHPDYFVKKFAEAGADLISIHVESPCNVSETLRTIRALGKRVGVAINPETAIEKVFPHLDYIDLVLVMGVHPGFCGQKFIESSLVKIEIIRQKNPTISIEIDGGIDLDRARFCIQRGANILVTGTSFFRAPNSKKFVQQIEHE
jgi:ribulose-phosphate 3-epimerase